jgi:hypothetical protein
MVPPLHPLLPRGCGSLGIDHPAPMLGVHSAQCSRDRQSFQEGLPFWSNLLLSLLLGRYMSDRSSPTTERRDAWPAGMIGAGFTPLERETGFWEVFFASWKLQQQVDGSTRQSRSEIPSRVSCAGASSWCETLVMPRGRATSSARWEKCGAALACLWLLGGAGCLGHAACLALRVFYVAPWRIVVSAWHVLLGLGL